jgi:hypothetical protein
VVVKKYIDLYNKIIKGAVWKRFLLLGQEIYWTIIW